MRVSRSAVGWSRSVFATLLVAAASLGADALGSDAGGAQSSPGIPATPDDRAIVHVLNRLGFGPTPGDVARIRETGLDAYIDAQLHPERIADEKLQTRLAEFKTLSMSTGQLARDYYIPAMQERRQAQRAAGAAASTTPEMRPEMPSTTDKPRASQNAQGERLVLAELTQQKILRAAYSERQLQEVMVDFWFNHFNVFAGKGQTRIYLTEYERDAIRPRVFGKFRDLLGAVAQSPAMLFYLDNWQSAAPAGADTTMESNRRRPLPGRPAMPGTVMPRRPGQPQQGRQRGINENYARELMELHTLGVDGGYAQKDVQEIARAFTGWTIEMPRQGGGFHFNPRMHDDGEKKVLGTTIRAGGGRKDGEQVLDLLARHPSTATFIATKLARRFVADVPPPALIDRAAARFRDTGGDIREVVRTIVTSPEFFAATAYRAKVKTPLDFVASAVRATGVEFRNGLPLVQAMRQLGMPLYMCQPPTGYSDKADAWVNTGALLNRMNFAVTISSGRPARGALVDPDQLASDILAGDISPLTSLTVAKAATGPQRIALLLGSPDFQKR